MNGRRGWRVLAPVICLVAVGCAAHRPAAVPAWVSQGVSALPEAGRDTLYGIGRAEPAITNVPLSKVTAQERARVELARALQTEILALVPAPGAERLVRPVVEAALPRHRVIGMYLADDGARYALVGLPVDELTQAISLALRTLEFPDPAEAAALQAAFARSLAARGPGSAD